MALVLTNLYNYYNFLFKEYHDPRVEKYPLVGSPIPVFAIIFGYLYFVTKWGPYWMQNRKPYDLKYIIIAYNFSQIMLNLWISWVGLQNSYLRPDFSFMCQPVNHANTQPYMQNLIHATFLYYVSKYLDLLDTVFFVLRKKHSHVTFLHVYHHAGMILAVYIFFKFLSGSHATLLGIINSFIHVIMYSYYFLTSFKSDLQHSLWWKRYITQLQLLQFAYLMFHFTLPILNRTCTYPKLVSFIGLIQNLFMFSLFSDFYYKAYIKKKPQMNSN